MLPIKKATMTAAKMECKNAWCEYQNFEKYISLPECSILNSLPNMLSNRDHKLIASKSGKTAPNPEIDIIPSFSLYPFLEKLMTTVPIATPDNVCVIISIYVFSEYELNLP